MMLVAAALTVTAFQSVHADEGDSKLIGPMFQPIKVENPRALDAMKGRSLQDRGRIDGIVGPAMQPPVTKKPAASGTEKKPAASRRSSINVVGWRGFGRPGGDRR